MKISNNAEKLENITSQLLELVSKLASEMHPSLPIKSNATLKSNLDNDLGFDSLGRVELMHRVETTYGITLPASAFSHVEVIGDLLNLILKSQGESLSFDYHIIDSLSLGGVEDEPDTAKTFIDILKWHMDRHPDRPHIEIYKDSGRGEQITYRQLFKRANQVAWGLVDKRITPSARVTIMLATGPEYFYSFIGILLAGAVPVPIYPPMRLSQLESYITRHQAILNNCRAEVMIVQAELKRFSPLLKSLVPSLREVMTEAEFSHYSDKQLNLKYKETDTAFIQYTSGSTSEPKGVQLSHANLLANIRAMGRVTDMKANDVFVSWLPLYHDMGLIGAWLSTLYFSAKLVVMSPLEFLARPQRWLWAIHRYQGTVSAAPNFAFELCIHRIAEEELEHLNLNTLRIVCNGAEPIIPDTLRSFFDRFAKYGFRASSMWPVYGLAESSVGLAFPKPHNTPYIQKIDRDSFMKYGQAKILSADAFEQKNMLEFVACGEALPNHQIRIVDDMDNELPDRCQGHLQFKGPSATKGYFRNPEKTRSLFHQDWLDSGDLAYQDQGQLYLTGRSKDIIIRAGRNIYPHEIEEAVGTIEGIRRGRVVAFGVSDARSSEKLVVLAETRETDPDKLNSIKQKVVEKCAEIVDLPPDDIVLGPVNTILKTSSGKLRRSACRELYINGQIGKKAAPLWWQFTKIVFSGSKILLQKQWGKISTICYAAYSWSIFMLFSALSILLILMLTTKNSRKRALGLVCRMLAKASFVTIDVKGIDNLTKKDSFIMVANHSSYIDAFVILATISIPFNFVAKAELARNPILHFLLKRLGVEFVERYDRDKSVADANEISKIKESLFYFPEGTFTRKPGLVDFHMGAFLAAVKGHREILPITINGSRAILRSDSWFPRRGKLEVYISEPISSDYNEEQWQSATSLKNKARQEILKHYDEPDLESF